MAAPTPVISRYKSGNLIVVNWYAAWTDSTQLTDSIVLDISADSPSGAVGYQILYIAAEMSTGIQFNLEFDATTDTQIVQSALGATSLYRDFRHFNSSAVIDPRGSGTTGDVLITTLSAANLDEISLTIIAIAK